MPRFRYVMDESALSALLVLSDREIAALMPVFESLTEDPFATVDFYILDAQGRRLPNRVAGNFFLTYWFERDTGTVFILRINRIQPT